MNIPLTEAAKKLGIQPIELVVALSPLVNDFSEIYPNVDDGLIQTVQELLQQLQQPLEQQAEDLPEPEKWPPLSDVEKACLVKLARKKFWGHRTISEDALRKSFFRDAQAPGKSIEELVKLGILLRHGKHEYSLNPQKKLMIELMSK